MPRGASPRREREYRELKQKFEKSGRYPGREEEVAARVVNQQRSRFGETKTENARARHGQSSDRNLPMEGYQHLTIPQIRSRIDSLSGNDQKKILVYEKQHKNRKGVVQMLQRRAA